MNDAEKIEMLLAALEAGYVYALGSVNSLHRIKNQAALCQIRDAICLATGRDSQDVQDTYESQAIEARAAIAKAKS